MNHDGYLLSERNILTQDQARAQSEYELFQSRLFQELQHKLTQLENRVAYLEAKERK